MTTRILKTVFRFNSCKTLPSESTVSSVRNDLNAVRHKTVKSADVKLNKSKYPIQKNVQN